MKTLMRSLAVVILVSGMSNVSADQTLREKMTPPADSVDEKNLRIWLPIERANSCRLMINITDSSDNIVRHYLDFLAPGGTYNFYWNKKDDSGNLVEPGSYKYNVDDCGEIKTGNLKVQYRKWERESRVVFDQDSSGFILELLADSAAVKVQWFDMKKKLLATLYIDDEMGKGNYHFNWTGDREDGKIVLVPEFGHGFYVQRVKVGEFIHEDTIRWSGN